MNTQMYAAVEKGELGIVEGLIRAHVDLNLIKNDGNTLLLLAVSKTHKDACRIVEKLIAAGANLTNGIPLLRVAVQNESKQGIKIVNKLIEKGLDVNQVDGVDGTTPLFIAARYVSMNALQIIKCLVENNANVHHELENGETCLFQAVRNKHAGRFPSVVKYLLEECRMDINKRAKDESTPVGAAIEAGQTILVKYFFEQKNILKFKPTPTDLEKMLGLAIYIHNELITKFIKRQKDILYKKDAVPVASLASKKRPLFLSDNENSDPLPKRQRTEKNEMAISNFSVAPSSSTMQNAPLSFNNASPAKQFYIESKEIRISSFSGSLFSTTTAATSNAEYGFESSFVAEITPDDSLSALVNSTSIYKHTDPFFNSFESSFPSIEAQVPTIEDEVFFSWGKNLE